MNHAIIAGDTIEARVALEEARELRPEAPELGGNRRAYCGDPDPRSDAGDRVHPLPRARRGDAAPRWDHALMGIDWMRSADAPIPGPVPHRSLAGAAGCHARNRPDRAGAGAGHHRAASRRQRSRRAGNGWYDRSRSRHSTRPANPLPQPPPFRAATAIENAPPALDARPASAIGTRPINGETPDDFVFVPPQAAAVSRQRAAGSVPLPPGTASQALGPRPLAAAPAPAAAASVVASPIPTPVRGDQTGVAAVLNQYARAYGQLDAGAAREVWPTVNERALARAFAGLTSQDVAFDDCEIDVRGARANASCRGKASYVGKIGSGEQRTESRTWRFELRRDGDAWKIENAEARRQ